MFEPVNTLVCQPMNRPVCIALLNRKGDKLDIVSLNRLLLLLLL
jgi:hypothetical protein